MMKKFALAVATVAAALTWPGFASAAEPVKIGVALSQTGNLADSAGPYFKGLDLWREQANARGGLAGRPVEFIVYDDVAVIRDVSMIFPKGIVTTIVGSNGAGKSTAVKVGAGLLRAWKGSILLRGTDITREPADRRVYRGVAYVPQGRIVVPEMSVRDNLMIGAHILGGKRAAIDAAMERVLQLFPVLKPRMKHQADTMSGGEQQMLAIGRALMTSPEIIMLDEPSLGLSPKFVDIVFEKLLSLRGEGMTVVMVEQKASHALGISDRGYVMHLGQVACEGTGADLLANDDVKRLFLGEIPESMKALGLTDA